MGRSVLSAGGHLLLFVALICGGPLQTFGVAAERSANSKSAKGPSGMVAASTPYATAAGVAMLQKGGNAVDAAVASLFALTVTDPPMTSLGGRCQMIIALADGSIVGIDGATRAPANLNPPNAGDEPRKGFQVAPVPGVPAAAAEAVARFGRLSLAEVLQPAIQLAETGFALTPKVARIWRQEARELALDQGARTNYLKPDGQAYRKGEIFRHPRLAALLRRIAKEGPAGFYQGEVAHTIARDIAERGGFLATEDLETYRVEPGEIVRTSYRGFEIVTLGRRTWGHTLVEMLNMLAHFELNRGQPIPSELELTGRIISQALEDRPETLGTLVPKPDGYRLDLLASADFGLSRARRIQVQMGQPLPVRETATSSSTAKVETTHLSTMDAEGNAVALTTSIGPRFGARVATPDLGFLYAYSYNMQSNGLPRARASTEMTPTIVLKNGRPILAVGAAGSERIPVAVFQVISNVIDRGYSLEEAVGAPRVFCSGNVVALHDRFPQDVKVHLESLGFRLDPRNRGINQHLGIVHAVQYNPLTNEYIGAADPVYDGSAEGPSAPHSEQSAGKSSGIGEKQRQRVKVAAAAL